MKDLEKYAGKRMPYKESDDYVARLIERSAENAVQSSHKHSKVVRLALEIVSVAAVLAVGVMLFAGLNTESDYERIQNSMSLSEVLNSMSEEELMSIDCYAIEDIPEYE